VSSDSNPARVFLAPVLTPRGHLLLSDGHEGPALDADVASRLLDAFARGDGEGLLQLGAGEVGTLLPPALAYWRDFAAQFVAAVCAHPDVQRAEDPARSATAGMTTLAVAPPETAALDALVGAVPPMIGAEYLNADLLRTLWRGIETALVARLSKADSTVQDALKSFNPAWHTVGRVHFHLAENRKDPDAPFAFLATYTHALTAHAKPQHLPLGQALREYAGVANKRRLLSLLLPVQRAAERCEWLRAMVDAGEIFHALRWTPRDAVVFLRDVHALEQAGVIVRVPASWKAGRPPRPRVTATVGSAPPSGLGLETLLDFRMEVTLDGEALTPEEIRALLEGVTGLALLRGRWVEVDRDRLSQMIEEFGRIERAAMAGGVSFADAMRLLARTEDPASADAGAEGRHWAEVTAGPWLAATLGALRGPDTIGAIDPGVDFRGTLRPYQQVGLRWLHLLSSLCLGACLADDMGLGKTVQVLALILARKRAAKGA
jgi:non-specific serine/threonine protein kinase